MSDPTVRSSLTPDAYRAQVGNVLGVSEWVLVDQARIDRFADCTNDHQFIHVDPARAAETPFGGTVAHGFLTLSLIAGMSYEVLPRVEGAAMGINYGLNKLRFMAPVRSGRRVRGQFRLIDFTVRPSGMVQLTTEVTVEIEGENKPALIAEWITLASLEK